MSVLCGSACAHLPHPSRRRTLTERHGHSVLGVDTHRHTHVAVAVALDGLGRHRGELQVPATTAGTTELLAWCDSSGGTTVAGVEGTGSYGHPLTRALQRAGIRVLEVNRPDRANRRRRGKSDPIDAQAATRAVVSGHATGTPKDREAAVEALRAVTIARNSAGKAIASASNQMKALLVGADDDVGEQMRTPRLLRLAQRCAKPPPNPGRFITRRPHSNGLSGPAST